MDVAVLQLVSRTDTRTRAAVEEIPGNVHAYEPVLGMSRRDRCGVRGAAIDREVEVDA